MWRSATESLWVSGGAYAVFGAMFIVSLVINRRYGTAELGNFGIAWAAAQLATQAATSGLSAIHRREVSYVRSRAAELVAKTLTLRMLGLAVVFAGALAVTAGMGVPRELATAVLAVMLGKSIEALGMTFAETLQVMGENRVYAQLTTLSALVYVAAVLCAAGAGMGAAWIYWAAVLAGTMSALASWGAFRHRAGGVRLGVERDAARGVLHESWPLMVNSVVAVAAARASVLAVGFFAGEEAAGVYTFAAGVVGVLSVVAGAAGVVLFPKLCAVFADAPHHLQQTLHRTSLLLAGLGTLLAAALVLLGGLAVRLYGDLPPYALGVLLTLGVGLIAGYGAVPSNYMFTVIKQQREGMALALVNLAALATLLLALVPPYGARGAALAVTITQTGAWLGAVAWLDLRHLRALRSGAPGLSRRDR